MKHNESKAIAIGHGSVVLREFSLDSGAPRPILYIYNGPIYEGGNLYPSTEATVQGESVRALFHLLRDYFAQAETASAEDATLRR